MDYTTKAGRDELRKLLYAIAETPLDDRQAMNFATARLTAAAWAALPRLLDQLDAQDRRIADLEREVELSKDRLKRAAAAAEQAIRDYRCHETIIEGDGDGFPLVDKLCTSEGSSIDSGQREMEMLVDSVCGAILHQSPEIRSELVDLRQRAETAEASCAALMASADEVARITVNEPMPSQARNALVKATRAMIKANPGEALLAELRRLREVVGKLPTTDDGLYYIASFKHGYVGNDVQFWGPKGGGYTCILSEAGTYTLEQARGIHCDTAYDATYMLSAKWVRENFRCVVEVQRAGGREGIVAASREAAEAARKEAK